MGSSYSYLKIDIRRFVGKFFFVHDGYYHRSTIVAGHPDNAFSKMEYGTAKEYNSEGDWYYYNGDSEALYRVLRNFNPKNDNLGVLVNLLEIECKIEKYQSTWEVISGWAAWVKSKIPDIVINAASGCLITWLFSSSPQPQITA